MHGGIVESELVCRALPAHSTFWATHSISLTAINATQNIMVRCGAGTVSVKLVADLPQEV